jgi:hypothetical protein
MASISDLSDSMSVGQTLSAPLLGNLPKHERDERDEDYYYDEEAGCMPCSLRIVASNEELDEVSGDDSSSLSWWNGNSVPWVILPALLFLQFKFGMATTGMYLLVVSSAIALFVLNAIIYRQAIKDCKLTCTVVLLAPEIFISIILGLVILDHLATAFLFMEGSILFLAISGAAITIRGLIATSSSTDEEDCKQLHDRTALFLIV